MDGVSPTVDDRVRLFVEEGVEACIKAFAPVQTELANTEDAKEGVASFVERRDPVFRGR